MTKSFMVRSPAQDHSEGRLQTVVDIGTLKTTCMMAEITPGGVVDGRGAVGSSIEILGAVHGRSNGIKAGVVVDLDQAEATLRSVVRQVEKMAGVEVVDLILSVSCGRLRSHNFRATTPLETNAVTVQDILRLTDAGRSFAEREGRVLVHSNRIGFRLDDEAGIEAPVGMVGQKLSQALHMVTVDEAPLKNLLLIAERSYFNVEGLVAAVHASAEAVLSEEEKKLGVIAIDLGGGTSSFAVYADGHFIHLDSITLGGDHITYDIARSLSTPLHEAERIKTLYGTMITASSDECEMVTYPSLNEPRNVGNKISKAALGRIIRPRVEEILSLIRDRLIACKLAGYAGNRVVLTGGASQLQGIAEFSAHFLGRSVRVGAPKRLEKMPLSMEGPAFSNPVGQLLLAALGSQLLSAGVQGERESHGAGYLSHVGHWLRESF